MYAYFTFLLSYCPKQTCNSRDFTFVGCFASTSTRLFASSRNALTQFRYARNFETVPASHNNNRPEHSEWRSWAATLPALKNHPMFCGWDGSARGAKARTGGRWTRFVRSHRGRCWTHRAERAAAGSAEIRSPTSRTRTTVPRRERYHTAVLWTVERRVWTGNSGKNVRTLEHYWERNCSTLSNKNNTR